MSYMAKTIMVVDDEGDIRETLKVALEKHGYKVITAVNGDDCLDQLKFLSSKKVKGIGKPDLILMDIMMPGTPVKEVVPQIKDIKISYLTVVRKLKAKEEGLLTPKNVVGFIHKPFDVDFLIEKIEYMLSK